MINNLLRRTAEVVAVSAACSVATGLVFLVVIGVYYQRSPPVALAVVAGLAFLVTVPVLHELGQWLIRAVGRRGSWSATGALTMVLTVPPTLLIVQAFREPGEPLVQFGRFYIGEAIPWLVTFAISAGLFSSLRRWQSTSSPGNQRLQSSSGS